MFATCVVAGGLPCGAGGESGVVTPALSSLVSDVSETKRSTNGRDGASLGVDGSAVGADWAGRPTTTVHTGDGGL